MFCAIATTIDRCKNESMVDIFQVVKAQRMQKPGLLLTAVSTNYIVKVTGYQQPKWAWFARLLEQTLLLVSCVYT